MYDRKLRQRVDDGFDFGPVISEYSDNQAIDDGVLVNIASLGIKLPNGGLIDRITRNLFDQRGELIGRYNGSDDLDYPLQLKASCALDEDGDGVLFKLPPDFKLWCVKNERGNYTAMLPEDY